MTERRIFLIYCPVIDNYHIKSCLYRSYRIHLGQKPRHSLTVFHQVSNMVTNQIDSQTNDSYDRTLSAKDALRKLTVTRRRVMYADDSYWACECPREHGEIPIHVTYDQWEA